MVGLRHGGDVALMAPPPTKPTYSLRRSALIAALSAGSLTPSSRATWPHRIGRRLDFLETGQFEQASTNRSSFD